MRHSMKLICLLPVLALLASCASFSTIPVLNMEHRSDFPYERIVLDVNPATAEDVMEQTTDLQIRVVEELDEIAQIPEVRLAHPDVAPGNALVVQVSIQRMRKVSGVARFFFGAFAGKASMTTGVTFVDANTNETLGIYEITGKSGGSGMSGGTDDAVVQAAEGIVGIICETFGIIPPKDHSKPKDEDDSEF